VSTEGDAFAELIEREDLGAVVPERDVERLADALEKCLFDDKAAKRARENVARVRGDFVWEKSLAPLVEFCRNPVRAADKAAPGGLGKSTASSLGTSAGRKRSSSHRGLRRDLDRVRYYLANGGPAAVIERYRARRERKRKSRSA
jgi:hypothetical protein